TVSGISFSSVENLTGGNAANSFNFASGGSISGVLDGGPGGDSTINVNDQGVSATGTYVITPTGLSADGTQVYGNAREAQFRNYNSGSGGSVISWQGVASGVVDAVYTGSGANSVTLGDADNTLDAFQGTAVLQGQGSANTVDFADQGSTENHAYLITASELG